MCNERNLCLAEDCNRLMMINLIFERLALNLRNPKGELNREVQLFLSIFEDTGFPITMVIGVHDNRVRRLNVISKARARNIAIFQTKLNTISFYNVLLSVYTYSVYLIGFLQSDLINC